MEFVYKICFRQKKEWYALNASFGRYFFIHSFAVENLEDRRIFLQTSALEEVEKEHLNFSDAKCYIQRHVGLRYGEILEIGMASGN